MTDFLFRYSEIISIIMFFAPPILSVLILYFIKRSWIWLSIPITIVIDLLVWGKGIFESSHGAIALVFLIPQVVVVAIISIVILYLEKHRKRAKSLDIYMMHHSNLMKQEVSVKYISEKDVNLGLDLAVLGIEGMSLLSGTKTFSSRLT